ncbi:hypothetical protein BDV06DRAFT_227039 [Aspergillus oleicola]
MRVSEHSHASCQPWRAQLNPYKAEDFIDPMKILSLIAQFDKVDHDPSALLDALHSKVQEVSGVEALWVLSVFLVPLVSQLCRYLDLNRPTGAPSPARTIKVEFIARVPTTCITNRIQHHPTPRSDWSQSLPGLINCCADCDQLRLFIEHPVAQQQDFRVGKKRRIHLKSKVNDAFKWDIIHDTRPATLRITKTDQWFAGQMRNWSHRLEECRRELVLLNRESPLPKVIGHDAYQDLLALVTEPPELEQPARRQLGPFSALHGLRGPPFIAGGPPSVTAPTVPSKRSFVEINERVTTLDS